MSITNAFIIFNLLTAAIAGPLATRDTTCSPISMKDNQKVTTCPKKNTLDSSGHCRGIPNVPGAQGCTSYCEMTLSKGYGQEVPFHRGYCQDQTKCTVDTSESVSTTQTWTVEMKSELGTGESVSKALTGGFNIGASYSWSKTLTYTTSTQNQKVLKENQCGYWTYIPYVMESCGTVTQVGEKSQTAGYYGGSTSSYCDTKGKKTDVQNWCNKSLYKNDKGKTDGEAVFVFVNCDGGGLLEDKDIHQIPNDPDGLQKQPPAISHPGVFTGTKS